MTGSHATNDGCTGPLQADPVCGYAYDASSRLVRVQTPRGTAWRHWHGDHVANELRWIEGAEARLSWLGMAGRTLAQLGSGAGMSRMLLATDTAGCVLLEAATQVRTPCYAPHGFGGGVCGDAAAPAFNGEWLDAGSGCYLLGPGHHRPYSPMLGLFLAPDRASPFAAGGLNALSYCAGDPINRSDPSGHFWKWVIAGVTLALSAVAVGLSAGAALPALLGTAAMTKTAMAATASMTMGAVGLGAEAGALITRDEKVASILGYVGLGLAAVGAAGAVGGAIKAATKGVAKAATQAATSLSSKQVRFAGQVSKVKSSTLSDIIGLPSSRQRIVVNPVQQATGNARSTPLFVSRAARRRARRRGYPLRNELSDRGYENALQRAHEQVRFKGPSIDDFSFREDGLHDHVTGYIHRWDPVPSTSREIPWNLQDFDRFTPDSLPSYSQSQRGIHPMLPDYTWSLPPGHSRLDQTPQMTEL